MCMLHDIAKILHENRISKKEQPQTKKNPQSIHLRCSEPIWQEDESKARHNG